MAIVILLSMTLWNASKWQVLSVKVCCTYITHCSNTVYPDMVIVLSIIVSRSSANPMCAIKPQLLASPMMSLTVMNAVLRQIVIQYSIPFATVILNVTLLESVVLMLASSKTALVRHIAIAY